MITDTWEAGLIERSGPHEYEVKKPWSGHLTWHMHSVTSNGEEGGIYVTITSVTPVMAELMLQDSMSNRTIRAIGLGKIRRQLEKDLWIFNAVPMLFNRRAELGDGQHRAKAAMLSRVEFDSLLVVGIEDEAIVRTVDTNVARNAGDRLEMSNIKDARALAACCRLVHCYLCDDYTFRGAKGAISDQEILDMASSDLRIARAVRLTSGEKGWVGILQPSVVSLLRYLLAATDEGDCERFLEKVRTGIGVMEAGEPAAQLRQQLQNRRLRKQGVAPALVIPLAIKAWNLFRAGEKREFIRADGPFPEII